MAARALVSLIPSQAIPSFLPALAQSLPAAPPRPQQFPNTDVTTILNHNALHGTLLQIKALEAAATSTLAAPKAAAQVLVALSHREWLASPKQMHCPVVRGLYLATAKSALDVASSMAPLSARKWALQCGLRALDDVTPQPSPGFTKVRPAAAALALSAMVVVAPQKQGRATRLLELLLGDHEPGVRRAALEAFVDSSMTTNTVDPKSVCETLTKMLGSHKQRRKTADEEHLCLRALDMALSAEDCKMKIDSDSNEHANDTLSVVTHAVMKETTPPEAVRAGLRVLARLVKYSAEKQDEMKRKFLYVIEAQAQPSRPMAARLGAAEALDLSKLLLWDQRDAYRAWMTAVRLLQDEAPQVRSEAAKATSMGFVKACGGVKLPTHECHPNLALFGAFEILADRFQGGPLIKALVAQLIEPLSKEALDRLDQKRIALFPPERDNMFQELALQAALTSRCLAKAMQGATTKLQSSIRMRLSDALALGHAWIQRRSPNETTQRSVTCKANVGSVMLEPDVYEVAYILHQVKWSMENISKFGSAMVTEETEHQESKKWQPEYPRLAMFD